MPTEGSTVVVFNEIGEVLLVLREDIRLWALPGGRRESGESFEQTAVRETREETGYIIELDQFIGVYFRPQYPNGGDTMRLYTALVIDGDPSVHDWESLDVKWFPLDALPKRTFKFAREHIRDAGEFAGEPLEKEQCLSRWEAALMSIFLVFRKLRNLVLHRN